MANIREKKSVRRERYSWYLYDFANSAYSAIILLAVYSAYFKQQVVGGAEGSRLWGISVGIAMLAVALTSPWIGAVADFSGKKKFFLIFFSVTSVIATGCLFFVTKGDIFLGMGLFIIAEFGYRSAQVFYNSLLPEIAWAEDMGLTSGKGWAVGSVGGIVSLLLVLPMIMFSKGTPYATLMVRLSMVVAAAFYGLLSLPLFLYFREKAKPQALPQGETYLTIGFKRLWRTFKTARRFKHFMRFLISFLFYNNGIITALDFSSILAATLYGFQQQELIILMIVLHLANVVGGMFFGWIADKVKIKRGLELSILVMIVACTWLAFNPYKGVFYIIAAMAGFAMAGVQVVSRSMIGVFSPAGQEAEFYGLGTVAGSTTFIGPAVFGWVAAEFALFYEARGVEIILAEKRGQQAAVLSIVAFLVTGFILLLLVNEKKGREAAGAGK